MRDYEIRRGQAKSLEGDGLRKIATDVFGDAGTDGEKVTVTFGAIEKMIAWTDGKRLFIDTTMRTPHCSLSRRISPPPESGPRPRSSGRRQQPGSPMWPQHCSRENVALRRFRKVSASFTVNGAS